jgi:hypothetical protein
MAGIRGMVESTGGERYNLRMSHGFAVLLLACFLAGLIACLGLLAFYRPSCDGSRGVAMMANATLLEGCRQVGQPRGN